MLNFCFCNAQAAIFGKFWELQAKSKRGAVNGDEQRLSRRARLAAFDVVGAP